MNRTFSASTLAALCAAALIAGCAGREPEAAPVDQAAVDRYIAELAAAEEARAAAQAQPASQKIADEDGKIDKETVDGAERVFGALVAIAR